MASAGVWRYSGRVFRRLLLLFALLLALPATARPACHDAGASQPARASAHHMGNHREMRVTADPGHGHDAAGEMRASAHDCLGCIPPDMLLGARVDRAPLPRAAVLRRAAPTFAPGEAGAPTPPPPKNA